MALIALMNPKGGVGKTTLTVLIAGEFAQRGQDVLIIDIDSRQNIVRWSLQPESAHPNIEVKGAPQLFQLEEALREESEKGWPRHVVVDTEGSDTPASVMVGMLATVILIPSKLGGQDLAAAVTTATKTLSEIESLYEQEYGEPKKIPHLLILNEVDLILSKSKTFEGVGEMLKDHGIRLAKNRIWKRKAFTEITTVGGTVYNLEGTPAILGPAQQQSKSLLDEILEVIENEAE